MLEKIIAPQCICCNQVFKKTRFGLCEKCFTFFMFNDDEARCKYCSYPLPSGSNICGRCFSNKNRFDGGFALFPYNECGRALIHSIKFKDRIEYLRLLTFFEDKIAMFLKDKNIDVITYVPSSLYHYLIRGYSVPREMAKILSFHFSIPYKKLVFTNKPFKRLLSKSKSVAERKSIVKGFFRVKSRVFFENVLIVDDVFTTGTTVNRISDLLKKKNIAKNVFFLTLAMVVNY